LAFLALHERPVLRTHVSGSLWLDATEARASANLRSALWRIPDPGGVRMIVASSGHLSLAPRVEVDFRVAVRRAMSVLGGVEDVIAAADWERDITRLCGELLPDWYEDWVLVERERFRQLRLHALERLTEHLTALGRHAEAIQAGMAAIAAEPLRESAHRQLIKVHLLEGNVCEALRQYDEYVRLLHDELNLAPSPAINALIAGFARDRPVRPAE
jgi:DNA-binding SARP family transcriptional activator